jgi:hypothetical protein
MSDAIKHYPCKHGIFSHRVCEICHETEQLELELAELRRKLTEHQAQKPVAWRAYSYDDHEETCIIYFDLTENGKPPVNDATHIWEPLYTVVK